MKHFFQKTITLSVFDESNYKSRQYTVPQCLLAVFALAILVSSGMVSFLVVKSYTIHKRTTDPLLLEQTIDRQVNKIAARQQQIDLLNNKLGHLETRLADLEGVENEIRRIARIERSVNRENFFGVGGSKDDNTRQSASPASANPSRHPVPLQSETGLGYQPREDILYCPHKNSVTLVLEDSALTINPMTCIPSVIPANGEITKQFQSYVSPLTGKKQFHKGVLISLSNGGNGVKAPANGIVTFAGDKQGMGKMIIIDHGHGFLTRYKNLETISKNSGDAVQCGEVIGGLGNTDQTAVNHQNALYYEVLFNGVQVNPKKFISHCPFMI